MGKFNKGGGGGYSGGHGGHGGGFAARNAGGFGGGRKPWDKGGDRGPIVMHDATCSDCGKPCKVPFRPTGDKPVYCKDCFIKHGGPDRANSGPLPRRAPRPGFNDKTDYRTPTPRIASPDDFSSNDIKTQLAMLNIKLDKIVKNLEGNAKPAFVKPVFEVGSERKAEKEMSSLIDKAASTAKKIAVTKKAAKGKKASKK